MSPVPFLQHVRVVDERVPDFDVWPFSLPFVRGLSLAFRRPVTFFVGENGSGKSTLLEGLAQACGLPAAGGGVNELPDRHGPENESTLGRALRCTFRDRPSDRYFFRAEFQAHLASLLDRRRADPDFNGDPYARYGGMSLHARSHGEAFLEILIGRIESGLVLMDEPESALSPQRQLTLLARMAEMAGAGASQFVVATHSPILLTFPGAEIVSFDAPSLPTIPFESTSHVRITRGILEHPETYWRHLGAGEGVEPAT